MPSSIVVVDFSGTLIKPFVAEEANRRRNAMLGLETPSADEHARQHATKAHYDTLRDHIASTYAVSNETQCSYRQNYGQRIRLSGKDMQTMMMTELFRFGMYSVAKDYGTDIFTDGMCEALQKIKANGYQLAIVSGIREDIITGVLSIAHCPITFDHIEGQDPVLSRDDNTSLANVLAEHGPIAYMIGDKKSDLEPAAELGASAIFLRGGHASGGEDDVADHVAERADQLPGIIR